MYPATLIKYSATFSIVKEKKKKIKSVYDCMDKDSYSILNTK